ncbi:FAD-dependent oxidoreductase [Legionella sp. CNM-4043-24]|uniref:FAD-dependent oxidoreductase n=1 Tax=Legionella sp. CNM-4043-24 TaxID=3421646 RepID=UPI00403AA073
MKETIIPLFAFLEQVRKEPDKQSVDERMRHFAKIYSQYTQEEARRQSERCLDCGNPYCQWQCPVHNNIPQWLHLVAEGKIMEAADLAHETNSLPEVCGQVCPQEKLCEGACTLQGIPGAVTIGAIENYLTETALAMGWKPDLSRVIPKPFRVAVIGAGPAGLACADRLTRQGIAVTVYDKHPEIGGLLTFGIPSFKLEKSIMLRRRALLEGMGIRFQLNTAIDSSLQARQLLDDYDALFLATGADKGIKAGIPGEGLPGVHSALPFLIQQIYFQLGLIPTAPFDFRGKQVVVLGVGDTAMDCCRTALRLNASSVTCVSRRRMDERQGTIKDFHHAREEGVNFIWQQQAVAFHGNKSLQTIAFSHTGPGMEANLDIPSDVAIIAYGFEARPESWFTELNIQTHANGLIRLEEQPVFPMQTSSEKVFAGGDMVSGANLVVNAIAQGQTAAHSIVRYLTRKQ